MNQVVLVGHIKGAPELTTTENGKKHTSIILAVKRPFKSVDGFYESDFIKCSLWNNIAENACMYSGDGDPIGVKGRIQTDKYEDEDGNIKYSTYVVAENISFLATKKKDDELKSESNDE